MGDASIEQTTEKLSELLVLAEPSDLKALADVHTAFEELKAGADAEGRQEVAAACVAAAALIERIILEDVPDAGAAFEVVNRAVTAIQAIIRDARPSGEVEFPAELGLAQGSDGSGGAAAAAEAPAGIVDAGIFADFLARQPGVLDEMESLILALEKTDDDDTFAHLRRLIHTLKGEAGMLNLVDVARLCHVTEDLLGEAQPGTVTDTLLEVNDWLGRTFAALSGKGEPPEPVDAVIGALATAGVSPGPQQAAPEAGPEPVEPKAEVPAPGEAEAAAAGPTAASAEGARQPKMLEGDADLLAEFVTEAREHLDNADLCLLTLETTPTDEEALNAVFRAFHTIKGVAGFLALDEVQSLAHEAESLLDRARKGELSLVGANVDVTFTSIDMLKRMVQHVADSLASGEPMPVEEGLPGLIEQLQAAVTGLTPIAAPATPLPADATPETTVGEILVDAGVVPREAVEAAIALQRELAEPDKLGEILLEQRVVSPAQLEEALRVQRELEEPVLLGGILVEIGVLSAEELEAALLKQREPVEAPKVGELLVKSGDAAPQDVAHALRAQKQQRQATVEVKEAVKVDADRLDRMIDLIGELVIAESMVSQSAELLATAPPLAVRQLNQLDKITRELQEMGTSLRMVPIRATFQKMARLVRDLARKSGKKVEFAMAGEDTELDKSVVDKIGDPLVHMVRNSVDHGIESAPSERTRAGKPETGRVELRAFHKGGSIYIEIEDDGRGLDRQAILAKAVERGIVRDPDSLTDREVWNLIFEPGFSTAKKVTDVSGRGVGMDVVKRNIEALRGQVEIHSEPGRGSSFSIRLPLTLAIIDGMVVRVGTERYVIPTLSVVRSIRPETNHLFSVVKRGEMLSLQGALLPLFRLHRLFNIDEAEQDPARALVVVVEDENRQVGLLVDELLGQQQIVIKSLGETLSGLQGISGGAIMSDGRVGLILDVGGIVRVANADGHEGEGQGEVQQAADGEEAAAEPRAEAGESG
ncbi:MAG: Hpt domain-containing protein [Candidatus Hydrogenedentes bacterium]|nr:Hpt domain-containing protein [Candidatus Hydrogenedentota bacterium]